MRADDHDLVRPSTSTNLHDQIRRNDVVALDAIGLPLHAIPRRRKLALDEVRTGRESLRHHRAPLADVAQRDHIAAQLRDQRFRRGSRDPGGRGTSSRCHHEHDGDQQKYDDPQHHFHPRVIVL